MKKNEIEMNIKPIYFLWKKQIITSCFIALLPLVIWFAQSSQIEDRQKILHADININNYLNELSKTISILQSPLSEYIETANSSSSNNYERSFNQLIEIIKNKPKAIEIKYGEIYKDIENSIFVIDKAAQKVFKRPPDNEKTRSIAILSIKMYAQIIEKTQRIHASQVYKINKDKDLLIEVSLNFYIQLVLAAMIASILIIITFLFFPTGTALELNKSYNRFRKLKRKYETKHKKQHDEMAKEVALVRSDLSKSMDEFHLLEKEIDSINQTNEEAMESLLESHIKEINALNKLSQETIGQKTLPLKERVSDLENSLLLSEKEVLDQRLSLRNKTALKLKHLRNSHKHYIIALKGDAQVISDQLEDSLKTIDQEKDKVTSLEDSLEVLKKASDIEIESIKDEVTSLEDSLEVLKKASDIEMGSIKDEYCGQLNEEKSKLESLIENHQRDVNTHLSLRKRMALKIKMMRNHKQVEVNLVRIEIRDEMQLQIEELISKESSLLQDVGNLEDINKALEDTLKSTISSSNEETKLMGDQHHEQLILVNSKIEELVDKHQSEILKLSNVKDELEESSRILNETKITLSVDKDVLVIGKVNWLLTEHQRLESDLLQTTKEKEKIKEEAQTNAKELLALKLKNTNDQGEMKLLLSKEAMNQRKIKDDQESLDFLKKTILNNQLLLKNLDLINKASSTIENLKVLALANKEKVTGFSDEDLIEKIEGLEDKFKEFSENADFVNKIIKIG